MGHVMGHVGMAREGRQASLLDRTGKCLQISFIDRRPYGAVGVGWGWQAKVV